jgi:hypothetical protein
VLPAPDRLPWLEALFQEATETDPALPDPFWDLAVVNARFRGDFAEAQHFLTAARGLGYAHRMTPMPMRGEIGRLGRVIKFCNISPDAGATGVVVEGGAASSASRSATTSNSFSRAFAAGVVAAP